MGFTCAVALHQGWDDPYVPRTHEGLLKWKYPEMNSVDFLFEVMPLAARLWLPTFKILSETIAFKRCLIIFVADRRRWF